MNIFKMKQVLILTICLGLLFNTRESKAVVGISTGQLQLAIIGGLLASSCTYVNLTMGKGDGQGGKKNLNGLETAASLPCLIPSIPLLPISLMLAIEGKENQLMSLYRVSSLLTLIGGIVLLDNEMSVTGLRPLTQDGAKLRGFEDDEFISYNEDLEMINATYQSVYSQLNEKGDTELNQTLAKEMWLNAMDSFSPKTQMALAKLGSLKNN